MNAPTLFFRCFKAVCTLHIPLIFSDGKIYAVGGMGLDTNPRDTLMCYDIETNLWSSLPKMPTPRYATFSFLIHDKLYVLGTYEHTSKITRNNEI